MKKIIATVLAMVMALALCTTAFAAGEVKGFVKATTKDAVISNAEVTLDFTAAKDPKTTDGKTTAAGNVAYYTITEAAYAGDYVVVNTLGEADLVVYSDKDGKNVMMYLDKISPALRSAVPFCRSNQRHGQLLHRANEVSCIHLPSRPQRRVIRFSSPFATKTVCIMRFGKRAEKFLKKIL